MATSAIKDEQVQFNIEDFKCAFCINFLVNPILTRCGHNFCEGCITKWLNEKNTCPICNHQLTIDDDIFPDERTKRLISQLSIKCSNYERGCTKLFSPYELEGHAKYCYFKAAGNAEFMQCYFFHLGCRETFQNETQLQDHLAFSIDKHFDMLLEENINMKIELAKYKNSNACLEKTINDRNDQFQKSKDMKEQFTLIEKKITHQSRTLNLIVNEIQNNTNGSCIKIIENLQQKISNASINQVYLGPMFYTSPNGYKFRLSMTNHSQSVKFWIDLMKSENDDELTWPCQISKWTVTVIDSKKIDEESFYFEEIINGSYFIGQTSQSVKIGNGINYFKSKINPLDDELVIRAQVVLGHTTNQNKNQNTQNRNRQRRSRF